jgi:hypothetical protein
MVPRNVSSSLHPAPVCQSCEADMVLETVRPCAERYDLWSYRCIGCSVTFLMVEARGGHHAARIEQRAIARRRMTGAATIAFDGGAMPCMVSNLSAAGARLDIKGSTAVPAHFALVYQGSQLPCHVIWRGRRRLGVAFD